MCTVRVVIKDSYQQLSLAAAAEVAQAVRIKPNLVLGLATGSSPLGIYQELIRLHRAEGLDFSQVTTFNLDEYVGLAPDHPQSYHAFMHEHLFQHINVSGERTHVPVGISDDFGSYCRSYEQQICDAGGIDLQLLGIGRDGHIGFNEPGSSLGSRTRLKTLTAQTIEDNSRFFDRPDEVPRFAITMGVATILDARRVLLLASGKKKAKAVARSLEGPISSMWTASALQLHADATVFLDRKAARKLKQLEYYHWIQRQAGDICP
ncbi:MAG: glucosamine-6-phosphate deaminase [Planctomycetaceae bacterium]|nr:glucosamine-6-phosphate deaminase [Planctomycetaceae bacterium]